MEGCGKTFCWFIFDLKKKSHYRYKLAISRSKKESDLGLSDEIHNDLINGNSNRFWNSWQTLHGKQGVGPTRVNDKTDNREIAEEFAAGFRRIYDEANTD